MRLPDTVSPLLTYGYMYITLFLRKPSIASRNVLRRSIANPEIYAILLLIPLIRQRKGLVNEKLKKFAAEEGIIIETSALYLPSQNGVAEQANFGIRIGIRQSRTTYLNFVFVGRGSLACSLLQVAESCAY